MTEPDVKNATQRQNIEQERGREAWNDVKAVKGLENEDLSKKYRSLARGLNAMIQINGLGQTLGFLSAKAAPDSDKPAKVSEHRFLSQHLTTWMRGHFKVHSSATIEADYNGLLHWVIDERTTSSDYRRATTECLAFGVWLSRFAEAELKGDGQ